MKGRFLIEQATLVQLYFEIADIGQLTILIEKKVCKIDQQIQETSTMYSIATSILPIRRIYRNSCNA